MTFFDFQFRAMLTFKAKFLVARWKQSSVLKMFPSQPHKHAWKKKNFGEELDVSVAGFILLIAVWEHSELFCEAQIKL